MAEHFEPGSFLAVEGKRFRVLGWKDLEKDAPDGKDIERPRDFAELYDQGVGSLVTIYCLWDLYETAEPEFHAFLVHDQARDTFELGHIYTAGRPSKKLFPLVDAGFVKSAASAGTIAKEMLYHHEFERYYNEVKNTFFLYAWHVTVLNYGRKRERELHYFCLQGRRVATPRLVEANAEERRVVDAWEEWSAREPERTASEKKLSVKTLLILLACVIALPVAVGAISQVAGFGAGTEQELPALAQAARHTTARQADGPSSSSVFVSEEDSADGAARLVIYDLGGQVDEICASEALDAVALFTADECAFVHRTAGETLIEVFDRRSVFESDPTPEKASADQSAWWRAAYYECCYAIDTDRGWGTSAFEGVIPTVTLDEADAAKLVSYAATCRQ